MRQNQCITLFIVSSIIWVGLLNYYVLRLGSANEETKKIFRKLNELEARLDEQINDKVLHEELKQAVSEQINKTWHEQLTSENKTDQELKIPHDKDAVAVLVFSCNRITVARCLDQLIKYRKSKERFPIIVSQDCIHEQTHNIIESYKSQVYHIQQPDQSDIFMPPKERKFKGYFKIARHYKWALNLTFNHYQFNTVIVIEDDLDISPDFYEYFAATLPILQNDKSLWCVSAWNDNGKLNLVDRNAINLLYRTDFFPGLGWMLTRSLWQELLNKWPVSYWDDWMRRPEQRQNRSCIRPEISRTRTFGKIGVSNGQHKSSRYRNGDIDLCQRRMVDITRDKPIKVIIRVVVPVRDHPKFNFVGKLLGPKGNSLKRLQEETMTKMAILGRGSMRDRHKEEELRNSGDPRFSHLLDELHVEITAFAPPAEAHARIAYALSEVRRFLVPDYNDEIRQEQMWEMHILNRSSSPNMSNSSNKNTDISCGILEKSAGELLSNGVMAFPGMQGNSGVSKSSNNSVIVHNNNLSNYGTSSSNGSLTPPELPNSVSPTPVLMSHPAMRGLKNKSVGLTSPPLSGSNMAIGRKRPLLSGVGPGTRLFMSPTKRTVLSILARAKAAQNKEIIAGYTHHPHITAETLGVPNFRKNGMYNNATNILLN
ncbi:putative alpha-1,3-mannosyl-glycoprotein 2-beta-N-acetylglucosaminyltransferase isoform X2 [Planococcus citri]|uniref:putative alpha-1,3-mannosyl-glycoprotein 2-beta-N-acetylglucosaminyltransferase isoform X2 n=1 Tax=Planococcus citri TaxID=170843 RepID=UPI0031F8B2FB